MEHSHYPSLIPTLNVLNVLTDHCKMLIAFWCYLMNISIQGT